jgi:hypothetical protein
MDEVVSQDDVVSCWQKSGAFGVFLKEQIRERKWTKTEVRDMSIGDVTEGLLDDRHAVVVVIWFSLW